MADAPSPKSVLLSALESIEEVEGANDGHVEHLVVCWVVNSEDAWNVGHVSTDTPPFMSAALLEHTADTMRLVSLRLSTDDDDE